MAGNGIGAIGGVHHYATFLDDFCGLLNEPWLGRLCMYLKELAHGFFVLDCFKLAARIVSVKLEFEYA
jgi:hypothetical protein